MTAAIVTADDNHSNPAATKGMLRKTRPCAFFLRGACTRGNACTFAHGNTDLVTCPDFSYTQMCKSYLHNRSCPRGVLCRFAHTVTELRPWRRQKGLDGPEAIALAPSLLGSASSADAASSLEAVSPPESPRDKRLVWEQTSVPDGDTTKACNLPMKVPVPYPIEMLSVDGPIVLPPALVHKFDEDLDVSWRAGMPVVSL